MGSSTGSPLSQVLTPFLYKRHGENTNACPFSPWVSHDGAEASTRRKIEGHDLVPGDAVENPVGTKAQTAGSAELGRSTGWEHTNELAVRCAVLTNAGYRIRQTERVLAGDYDVAVGRHRKVERAQLRINDQSRRLETLTLGKRNNGVVAFAIGADARGEQGCAVAAESTQIIGRLTTPKRPVATNRFAVVNLGCRYCLNFQQPLLIKNASDNHCQRGTMTT
jgi:hypothetical protein